MKRHVFTILGIFSLISFLLLSCSEPQEVEKASPGQTRVENLATTPADIKKEAEDLAKTTMAFTEEQKELYQKKIQEKMALYNQKLMDLKKEMGKLNDQAKAALDKQMVELNQKKLEITAKLKEAEAASGEAYEDLKKGLDKSLDDLDQAFEDAVSRFQK